MKRGLDLLVSIPAGLIVALPSLLIALAIRMESQGPALYWSTRIGRGGKPFRMPKFRSMRIDAPELATDRLESPDRWITGVGRLLRRTSLDELPQVWSVIRGDMSLVGPRPALHNQHRLIAAREAAGVHALRPGITGWAQVNGRDEIPEDRKVALDREYLRRASIAMDARILALTVLRVVRSDGVKH
jgi:O-antigen biosynthesis protein WbqP